MTLDNERRNISIQERKNSPIIGLKNFNNWVKTVLINKFCVNPLEQQAMMDPSAQGLQHTHNSKRTVGKQMLNTSLKRPHAHRNLRVLDMGCGKGGDLQKWGKVGTADYVGFGASH